MGRLEAEAFSGAMVESVHGEGDLLRGDGIEAQFFREELSDEAVHVLVGATLPGGIGMGEEEVGIEYLGDSLMASELLAVVGCQRMHAGRERRQQGDHGTRDDLGSLGWHMGDQGIAGLAFVEGDQRLLMASTDDQIGFPVAKAAARIDDGRALLDGHLVGNGATPVAATIAFPTYLLAAQGAVQHASGTPISIDALIDGFVADTGLAGGLEIAGDLLGAPQLGELGLCKGPSVGTNAAAVLTGPHAGL